MASFYIESGTGRQLTDLSTVDPTKTYTQSGTGAQISGAQLKTPAPSPTPTPTPVQAPTTNYIQPSGATPISPTSTPPTVATLPKATPVSDGSIVDFLNSSGQASDFTSRSKLATQYGIQNYTGTADQNTQLLHALSMQKAGASTGEAGKIAASLSNNNVNDTGVPKDIGNIFGLGGTPNGGTALPLGSLSGSTNLSDVLKAMVNKGTITSDVAGLLALAGSPSADKSALDQSNQILLDAMKSLGGESADLKTALTDQGVFAAADQVKQLTLQAAQQKGELDKFDAETTAGLATLTDQAIPQGLVQGQQAEYQKQRDLTRIGKAADLSATIALTQAYQGNIDLGTKLAQQSVDLKYQPIENNIKVLQQQIATAKDTMNADDVRRSAVISELLKFSEARITDAKTNDKTILTYAAQAAAGGAPLSVTNAMRATSDPVEAAHIGAAYLKGPLESTGTGSTGFTTSQVNNGSQNAGVSSGDFAKLEPDVQNFFVNAPQAQINAITGELKDVASGAVSVDEANKWVDAGNITPAMKTYLKSRISGVTTTSNSGFGQFLSNVGSAIGNFFGL